MAENKIRIFSEEEAKNEQEIKSALSFQKTEAILFIIVCIFWLLYFFNSYTINYGRTAMAFGKIGNIFIHTFILILGILFFFRGKRIWGWIVLIPGLIIWGLFSELISGYIWPF